MLSNSICKNAIANWDTDLHFELLVNLSFQHVNFNKIYVMFKSSEIQIIIIFEKCISCSREHAGSRSYTTRLDQTTKQTLSNSLRILHEPSLSVILFLAVAFISLSYFSNSPTFTFSSRLFIFFLVLHLDFLPFPLSGVIIFRALHTPNTQYLHPPAPRRFSVGWKSRPSSLCITNLISQKY